MKPVKMKLLVLTTCEKTTDEDKLSREHPDFNDLKNPLIRGNAKGLMYYPCPINQTLGLEEEDIKQMLNYYQCFIFEKIKIKTEHLEPIKILFDIFDKLKNEKTKIILSDESLQTLKSQDLNYLIKIKGKFLTEQEDSEQQKKNKKREAILHERVLAVARDQTITPMEISLYLYLCGLQIKAIKHDDDSYAHFDYQNIAEEVHSLGVSNKEVIKALDRLKHRGLIKLTNIKHEGKTAKFFRIADRGPIDLNYRFNSGFNA